MVNVIWITADTFRKDHVGAYGNPTIRTPSIDALAAQSMRFDRHYAASFPTMPTRADHATGRWTLSFLPWGPLPDGLPTLAERATDAGIHTAAVVDTPFYLRHGMNFDRGFQTFHPIQSQEGSPTRVPLVGHHESRDIVAWWRKESDRAVAQTMIRAGDWLELHHKEDFFLYIDTWDPHEPWDAPNYYTEMYLPGYDGEVIQPLYGNWHDYEGYTADRVAKAHATYCGEVTLVDTWIGYLIRKIKNLGLMENTAVIFTSDHGFYFGEHGGHFGKMVFGKRPDGSRFTHGERNAEWDHSPLYEEVAAIPLIVKSPGHDPGTYGALTSAVDLMPTVSDLLGLEVPDWVTGRSLAPALRGDDSGSLEFVITSIPFANDDDGIRSVDNVTRGLQAPLVTTVTSERWSLLYTSQPGRSELFDLKADPTQLHNVIGQNVDVARALHANMISFMRVNDVPESLVVPRNELYL